MERRRAKLVFGYGAGAALLASAASLGAWPLLWPATALLLVALAYATGRPRLLGKGVRGPAGLALRLACMPARTGARVNAWAWLRHRRTMDDVVPGLWLGAHSAAPRHRRVVDLTAEMPAHPGAVTLPFLDLLTPDPSGLAEAARLIEGEYECARDEGASLLVACALGFSRSAAAVATWLVATGRAHDAAQARRHLMRCRSGVRLSAADLAAIDKAAMLVRSGRAPALRAGTGRALAGCGPLVTGPRSVSGAM